MGGEPSAPTAKRVAVQTAVLEATEALLAEGTSYPELKIERIATRAGISRTAFYFYFKDKRELLMRLTEEVTDELFAAADLWFSGPSDQALDEMRDALHQIAALYDVHGTLLRAIVEVSTYDEEFAQFWRGLTQRFADASTRRIEDEQKSGRAPEFDAAAASFALTWMTERTFYQHFVQGFERERVVDAVHGIWVRAIYGRVDV
ncbi:MAG TPA: TetR/AcrR family transcriptional regulator [Solirubrobacteraceae bacterium]